VISRVWAHHKNLMQIDPYCQRRKCTPVNVVASDIRVMEIIAGVREIWGVKQESGRLRCIMDIGWPFHPKCWDKSATHSIYVKLLHKHDKLTQCCCAFTLVLARLSCTEVIFTLHTRTEHNKIHQVILEIFHSWQYVRQKQ